MIMRHLRKSGLDTQSYVDSDRKTMLPAATVAIRATNRFLRRHRRVIAILAGCSATAYAIYRVQKTLQDYRRLIKEYHYSKVDRYRLQMHLLRSKGECIPALLAFLQTLRKRVFEVSDVTTPVKTLKAKRNELSKLEEQLLWQQVKISSFTRFLVAYYGFNLLNVMLRVQVHILGRYAFESTRAEFESESAATILRDEDSPTSTIPRPPQPVLGEGLDPFRPAKSAASSFGNEERYRLLSLVYEFFLGPGLWGLKEAIEQVVTEELADWSVHEKVAVPYVELYDTLRNIRRRLEGPRGMTTADLPLLRFIMDPDAKTEPLEGKLFAMVNETWDAFESPSFKFATEDCLDATFRVFLENLHRALYVVIPKISEPPPVAVAAESPKPAESSEGKWTTPGADAKVSNPPEACIQQEQQKPQPALASPAASEPPLAKLIAHVKNAGSNILNQDLQGNEYIRVTADNRSVDILCRSFFTLDDG